jgi:hypothetical protein
LLWASIATASGLIMARSFGCVCDAMTEPCRQGWTLQIKI